MRVVCFVLLLVTKFDVAVVRGYRVKEFEVKRGRKGMAPMGMGLRDGEHPCNKTIQ